MLKRILPLLFAINIISCNRPSSSETKNDPVDTVKEGNEDGSQLLAETDSSLRGEDPEEEEEVDHTEIHNALLEIGGFSSDGKYFVFTQVFPGDYTGSSGYVYVIDVAKNEWSGKPLKWDMDDGESTDEEVLVILARKRDSLMAKRNIKLIVPEFSTDLTRVKEAIPVAGSKYNLDLKVADRLIDLHLTRPGKDITLQKDSKLPASRGSVRDYRLFKALTSGDKIAVFIEYDGDVEEGFENSRYYDRKYIAVTGVVK
jgi:predicted secreted protein